MVPNGFNGGFTWVYNELSHVRKSTNIEYGPNVGVPSQPAQCCEQQSQIRLEAGLPAHKLLRWVNVYISINLNMFIGRYKHKCNLTSKYQPPVGLI